MKYSVNDYAKALDGAIANPKSDKTAIIKNFLALARRNNDEGRLKKILDEALRLARGRGYASPDSQGAAVGVMRQVTIQSARPLSKTQEKIIQKFLKPSDTATYEIDSDLIAGIKIIVNDELQFDGTMKAKLDRLFGN